MSLAVEDNIPIKIHNDQLTVEIARPGSVYAGTRFDWSGFITQVTLAISGGAQHTYCVPESLEPGQGTGGWGLCNEFGNDKPIGYADAQPGESFPKLGIGLLNRPERPQYNFFLPHDIDHLFPIQIDSTENRVTFTVEPIECRGYAARLTKTVSVRENWLEIAYRLENVGNKLIDTNEYCHNFIALDKHPIGPEYRLHFPYQIQLENISAAYRYFLPPLLRKLLPTFIQDKILKRRAAPGNNIIKLNGPDFNFSAMPHSPFYFRQLGFSKTDGYQWELTYLPNGIKMREYDDFGPCRVAVWGTTHVISAEIFIDLHLPPGQAQSWTRRYEFLGS